VWQQAVASGRLVTSQGSGRTAWVARSDCAAVAAAVLLAGPSVHGGLIQDVTGPGLQSVADLASALGGWAGHPVTVEAVDDEAMVAHLVATLALAEDRAWLVVRWHRAIREGWFTQSTDVVARLTGRPARTIADLLAAG
jgi:NAD(P)H dehydrogenase (quinone)